MIFPPHRSRWVYGWLSFWRKKWKKVLHFDIHITYIEIFSLAFAHISHTHKRILLLYLHMNECSTVTTMTTTTTTSELLSQIYCSNNTSDERFDCNSWARNTHRDTRRPVWFAKSIKNCCALIVIRINSCIPHVKKRVRKISTYRFLFFWSEKQTNPAKLFFLKLETMNSLVEERERERESDWIWTTNWIIWIFFGEPLRYA